MIYYEAEAHLRIVHMSVVSPLFYYMVTYVLALALLIKLYSCFNLPGRIFKRPYTPYRRHFYTSLESQSKNAPSEYAYFSGNKVIIDDSNISKYSASIDNLLDSKLVGFDLEHVPEYYTFINPSSRKCRPSIVQICGDSVCFIYLLYKIGHVPDSLCRILDSKDILKVAHGAPSDMRLMFRHYGTRCSNFVDLIDICSRNNISPASLKNATESVLNLKLCKKQQCSNWEADQLDPEQISYASTDAWVARQIYLKIAPSKVNKLFVNNEGDIETE